ncbi:MAG: hypothetical protein DVB26_00175 [Verrucomicrobia bacterium]|nr:MAG: hypothetical protein DVB26_00175 [Verrucomicrobiota bacterium]
MSACFAFGLSSGDFIRETTLKVDMVNSAAKEGKHVERAYQPVDEDIQKLLATIPAVLFQEGKAATADDKAPTLADVTGLIEKPLMIQRKLAELRTASVPAVNTSESLAKLEAELPEAQAKAEALVTAITQGNTAQVATRVAAYAKRLAAIAAAPEEFQIVQEMSTLAEKETALAVSEAGANLVAIHDKHSLWTGLPVLIVVLLGGFTTNFIWCILLNWRNKTGYQYFTSKPGEQSPHYHAEAAGGEGAPAGHAAKFDGRHDTTPVPLLGNYIFSALAGLTWYFQFFFYSMGETQMGQYKFSSWTLHMASIIIFSSIWGLALHEWKGASFKAKALLFLGLVVLVASTMVVGYGNYLGSKG